MREIKTKDDCKDFSKDRQFLILAVAQLQSFTKYIWCLLDFTENFDLK